MQASRFGEESLFFAEPLRNRPNHVGIDPRTSLGHRMTGRDANRLERCLPANPARGRHVEMAAQAVRAKRNVRAQDRADDVVLLDDSRVGAVLDPNDVALAGHNSLREEEPRCEFEIVTGGSHRDRKGGRRAFAARSRLDSNFHRLLLGEKIEIRVETGASSKRATTSLSVTM